CVGFKNRFAQSLVSTRRQYRKTRSGDQLIEIIAVLMPHELHISELQFLGERLQGWPFGAVACDDKRDVPRALHRPNKIGYALLRRQPAKIEDGSVSIRWRYFLRQFLEMWQDYNLL